MPRQHEQLPLEAVRDLLGIARALYAAWQSAGQGPIEMQELEGIGRDLADALRLAAKTEPNTLGHRAAWANAERATQRLGNLVSVQVSLKDTVSAAVRRIREPPPTTPHDPSSKLRIRRMRG